MSLCCSWLLASPGRPVAPGQAVGPMRENKIFPDFPSHARSPIFFPPTLTDKSPSPLILPPPLSSISVLPPLPID